MPQRTTLRALAQDRRGATALMTGLLLIVVLGFVGFGIDFGAGFTARRAAQNAADSAAFSTAVARDAGTPDILGQARAVTARYGLVDGVGQVSVSVNQPPAGGAFAGRVEATEIVISRPAPRFFSGLFQKGAPGTIKARAVAATLPNQNGDGCVVAFNTTDPMSILANGNPIVNLQNCAIDSNSASAQALSMNGKAVINATAANVVGGFFSNGGAQLNAKLTTGAKAIPDPYADVALPSYPPGKCDSTNTAVNTATPTTFTPVNGQPFVFCNGLTVNGPANVTFAPGIYVIDGGSMTVNGSSTIHGTGVTFILTNHTGSNIATLTINGGADVNLTAPSSGAMSGLVFYQDRRAGFGQDTLNGGAKQIFRGALYFPKQSLLFNGGTSLVGGGCTQLLGDKVTFNGDSRLAIDCAGAGTRGIGGFVTTLVE
jgi:Flp pilus assembly protein TadG